MKPELLSPAGSPEALQAAIAAGADAIYLGASAHGARATAGFDDKALKNAINLAHLYGRRVYVTVNTLIKQQEMADVQRLLAKLCEFRADAVIVQDLGLVRLIKAEFPGLCIHASTQMSVHNAHGANILKDLGISRVVLARECDLETIQKVAQTGIETEVFIHGAMCVSVSGQCQFSSHIGGRSGNRGKCAQPCRLQYRYKGQSGALLSMRDLNTLELIPELLEAGASSFKIEGRLKRPEYVSVVTAIYRKALDRAEQGLPMEDMSQQQDALSRIFSRGFTAGHMIGEEDSSLIGTQRVSHTGVRIGRVTSVSPREGFILASSRLEKALHDGDGLQIRGREDQDSIYSGPPVSSGQIATLRLRNPPVTGDTLWLMQDEEQLKKAREDAMNLPPILLHAQLTLEQGSPASLRVEYNEVSVLVTGDEVMPAKNRPLDKDSAARLISKTGGTPFVLDKFEFISKTHVFLPVASLNALRREALAKLQEAIIQAHPLPAASMITLNLNDILVPKNKPPQLYAILPHNADKNAFRRAGVEQLILYPDNYRDGHLQDQLKNLGRDEILLLPRLTKDEDLYRIAGFAEKAGCRIMADNIGQLKLLNLTAFMGGEGIPVWNESALRMQKSFGVEAALLSRELSELEIKLLPLNLIELILPVYGRAQLMQLNHCPERLNRGLSRNKAGCNLCERGQGIIGEFLEDRFSCRYPLMPTHFSGNCLIALHHHKTLHLAALAPKMSWLMDLRMEKEEDALNIARYYANLLQGNHLKNDMTPEPGRFLLGVE